MAAIGIGAPPFVVHRASRALTEQSSDLPYLAELGYYEMDILDGYHRPPRFQIPTGVLMAGSAEAHLAMRVPQRDPRPPALIRGRTEARFLPVCLAASLLVCIGAGVGVVVHHLQSQDNIHSP